MSDFSHELPGAEEQAKEERRKAVRLLLRHPFVTDVRPDPEVFYLIRRHRDALEKWFRDQLGYRLVVDQEFARLHKRRPPNGVARPALNRSETPFDRRRYAVLCLVLAALERLELQTILSALAEEVKVLAASADGVAALDLGSYAERRCFVDAVRFLVDHGVLRLTDGDDVAFVDGSGDALYDVDSRRLTQMLAAAVPPSLAAGPEALAEEPYPPTDDGANRRLRHRLLRRLVEEPVLYFDELDEAERAYLTSQRHYLIHQVTEWTGLAVEVRREGLAAIDRDGGLTDVTFPATGTVAHAALLIADELARRRRETEEDDGGRRGAVAASELLTLIGQLLGRYGRFWSKAYREDPAGAERLLGDALERLEAMRLVRRRPEGVEPLPAIARYRITSSEA